MMRLIRVGVVVLLAAPWSAFAQPFDPGAEPGPDPAEPTEERIFTLESRIEELERALTARQPRVTFSGYVDVGFFVPQGDGTGYVQDLGPPDARAFPRYADQFAWVFLGDLLSTAVNTRGEPADLGNPPGIDRFDAIASRGAPGFIANEANLTIKGLVAPTALATASVNFAPRRGLDFRLGDSFDLDLAHLEWILGQNRRTSIFVGKTEGVLGIEYRERKSSRRFGITPSLIARYTTGTPIGLKVRSKLGAAERVVLAAAVSNGSSGIEQFHFHDEIDSNAGKTLSGRVQLGLPLGLELGASGEWGPQDHALDNRGSLWLVGGDLRWRLGAFDVKAEWLHGRGKGEEDRADADPHRPWGLRLRSGGYLEVDWQSGRYGLLARAEHRDALVWLGDPQSPTGGERMYVTRSWRATVGGRIALTEWVIAKAEYLRNGEYGGVPPIRNDVFTTSLVLIY
jgi:hypothetical protein